MQYQKSVFLSMHDSTKIMSLVALSNRYKEAISRLEGAVVEALNEI